jgi:hypothetical protein
MRDFDQLRGIEAVIALDVPVTPTVESGNKALVGKEGSDLYEE